MRKLFLSLLLVSAVATPAFADPNDQNDQKKAQAERQAAHADRGNHGDRGNGGQRPQSNGQPRANGANNNVPQQQIVRSERFQQNGPQNVGPDPRQVEAARERRGQVDGRQFDGRGQAPQDRYVRNNPYAGGRNGFRGGNAGVVSNVPRQGTQPPMRYESRGGTAVQWNRDWRRDNRYDWRRWRDGHGSRFHIGIYNDPFGWGYQPFSIGWRLWPNYYSSQYWISDPWDYQLPYAPPGTQWVRYYNDVLLVDLYSGEVVDVIHGFFW
jgi:Ni/Co efflux regulator RcnB